MDTTILAQPIGAIVGHGGGEFHSGTVPRKSLPSIGEQQAHMALAACRTPTKGEGEADLRPQKAEDTGRLSCMYCGADMRVVEDRRTTGLIHLSAKCPRCGCLRATYVELLPAQPAPHWFLEIPQEASFD
jgi:hypothetical protein